MQHQGGKKEQEKADNRFQSRTEKNQNKQSSFALKNYP